MIKKFSDFYSKLETGQKLQFPVEGSYCTLRATFNSGVYVFHVTVVQAITLLTVSDSADNRTTFRDLKQILQISTKELTSYLIPLFLENKKRSKILLKTPEVITKAVFKRILNKKKI